ncbi:hypothetical protein IVA78_09170 [Bradyrhizobium sp. 137]|uniref:hypothetical protein n=1 Tax=Bradyrhizobium sp. 137 TaxID=2782614 RepID=UPI001FFC1A5B|nr:hypothetical protein [Bradyrhizobium sp. 137]MCK1755373.1 hypothetical protein [Bradyrhizobium sp. 137]
MTMPDMTPSNQGQTEQSRATSDDGRCPPMTHQNSGGNGHEMYPQQFVRLIGCHDASLDVLRKRQDEQLH